MKYFLVLLTNRRKGAKEDDVLEAERFKRQNGLYIFYDGDGNIIAQYEIADVVGVRELHPPKE